MSDFIGEYKEAEYQATKALADSKYANDSYGCGTSFVTIRFKRNPKFYNWAKKNNLVKRDAYYGAVLEVESPVGGTLGQEFFNHEFCKALDAQIETGAFTHTYLN